MTTQRKSTEDTLQPNDKETIWNNTCWNTWGTFTDALWFSICCYVFALISDGSHIHDYPSRVPNLSLSGICSLLSRVWWCPSIKSSLAVASWSSRLGSSSGGSSTSSPSSSLVWGDFFSACWPNKLVDWQTSKNNKKYVSKYTHIG